MKDIIERIDQIDIEVRRLKVDAKTNRDFEDYEDALTDLEKAIGLLNEADSLLSSSLEDQDWLKKTKYELAQEYADVYGMKGGVYRRLDKLEEAFEMYEKGSEYERDFDIPDTYNRTNVIVLTLLKKPSEHQQLREDIEKTWTILYNQINGENKNNWWTWADFGLINLLRINLEGTDNTKYYEEMANLAYKQFKINGAGVQHFESTIEVLQELGKKIGEFDEWTGSLIEETGKSLEGSMPEV